MAHLLQLVLLICGAMQYMVCWMMCLSVCECSVLEPGRTLTLAEKAGAGAEVIRAAPGFRLVATMNPGGDYGKKELSPALSNRLTQIWVHAIEDEAELAAIIQSRITGVRHIHGMFEFRPTF